MSILKSFIRSFSDAKRHANVLYILHRTYSLGGLEGTEQRRIAEIVRHFGDTLNDHELAVQFLAVFVEQIHPDHPKAQSEVTKYIRMAKGAYKRGLANDTWPLEALEGSAQDFFGIDADSIPAL